MIIDAWLCEYTKHYWILYFKRLSFMLSELYTHIDMYMYLNKKYWTCVSWSEAEHLLTHTHIFVVIHFRKSVISMSLVKGFWYAYEVHPLRTFFCCWRTSAQALFTPVCTFWSPSLRMAQSWGSWALPSMTSKQLASYPLFFSIQVLPLKLNLFPSKRLLYPPWSSV